MATTPTDPSISVPPVEPLLERLVKANPVPPSAEVVEFPSTKDPLALAARTKAGLSPESQAKIARLVQEMAERKRDHAP